LKKKTSIAKSLKYKDILKNGIANYTNRYDMYTMAPLQAIPLDDKTPDWVKWNADWHEQMAIRELRIKTTKLQKLYNLAVGIINKSDYMVNPNNAESPVLGVVGADDCEPDIFNQFYPIIPNIIYTFLGEYLKRDKSIIFDATDPNSINEGLKFKEDKLRQALNEYYTSLKQDELSRIPDDQKEQQLQAISKIVEIETEFKTFRTVATQWAQHFYEKYGRRNSFDDLELALFSDSLIADECALCLNMHEDNFYPEVLRPMATHADVPTNKKNYHEGNSITNIEFMTIANILTTFKEELNADQIEYIESYYFNMYGSQLKTGIEAANGDYWDYTKSKEWNSSQSVADIQYQNEKMVENFMSSFSGSNNTHNYISMFNNKKLIRVARIWWKSMRRIGKLVKKEEGKPPIIEIIDENFIQTVEPEYDYNLSKEESATNLLKGEHVEWKYIPEWRYVVKIGQNLPFSDSQNKNSFNSLYLKGGACDFQFKGKTNLYDSKPPVIGRKFHNINTVSNGLVSRLKSEQLVYNVLRNRAMDLLPDDIGPVLYANASDLKTNNLEQTEGGQPLVEYMENLRQSKILVNKDYNDGSITTSKYKEPRIIDISTISKFAEYMNAAAMVKASAYETIGVSPQRVSQVGKQETATGIQQAVEGSVNQTEMYFDQFSNKYMEDVWQTIIEAGQYYTSISDDFSDTYINKDLEKVFFAGLKTDLLLKDISVHAMNKANIKKLLNDMKQLAVQDNTMGATFLDKVQTIMSSTPSEIIEKLSVAKKEQMEQEQIKRDHEKEMQDKQQQFLEGQRVAQEKHDDNWKERELNLEKYLGEIKAMGFAKDSDLDSNAIPDVLEADKFKHQQSYDASILSLKTQDVNNKTTMQDAILSDKQKERDLKQTLKEMDVAIAITNKNQADLKFKQLKK
jgi:hypothetical protein